MAKKKKMAKARKSVRKSIPKKKIKKVKAVSKKKSKLSKRIKKSKTPKASKATAAAVAVLPSEEEIVERKAPEAKPKEEDQAEYFPEKDYDSEDGYVEYDEDLDESDI